MKRFFLGDHSQSKNAWEFLRYLVAGNVLFLVTYGAYFVLHALVGWRDSWALAVASVVAHVAFFVFDKNWVFAEGGRRRKTSAELGRFTLFMGTNYFLNLGIVLGLERWFGLTPYVGQFVAAGFFTAWNYVGLKYWVFRTK